MRHPASSESTGRTRASRRRPWTRRRGEGGPVAAVVLVGGDGCVRVRAREREQRGGASRKSERGPRGWRGAPSDVQEQAASMRWPARARARRAHALLPTGRRLKTVAAAVGWAAQCWTSTGAGPALVGCTVLGCGWLLGKVQVISVLYFSVLFCFYLILLPLF